MSKERFRYDAVVKDLFQKDRPTLLGQLAEGVEVGEFLNGELAVVEERVADLLMSLSDGSILHLDFQSTNDRNMPYRVGVYGLLAAQKYRKKIRQVVIYMGQERMRMKDHLDLGQIQVAYRLVDIREFDSQALIEAGNPGDYALAMLANGGVDRMGEIILRANVLPEAERQRVFTQMLILAGLRGVSERLTIELNTMGVYVEVEQNAFLRDLRDTSIAQGRAEGKVEGKAEGKAEEACLILRRLLELKFGPLSNWAENRIHESTPAQVAKWTEEILKADSLEGVLGKR